MNDFRSKKHVIGTWCEIPSAYCANAIAKTGLDFIIVDMEHGVMSLETAQNMVLAAQCEKCTCFIRVPSINESYMLKALDTGADGLIIPHVENADDVKKIVEFAKYAPAGNRGFNPFIRAGNYGQIGKDYFATENSRTLLGVILEGKEAVENADAIAASPHIDICYIGQYDISVALGCPGDISNEKVVSAIKKATLAINSHGKMAGCMVHDLAGAREMMAMGIRFIVNSVDTAVLSGPYRSLCGALEDKG
jgi:4-hydroxy-2-oxoheptanedioate aldolase